MTVFSIRLDGVEDCLWIANAQACVLRGWAYLGGYAHNIEWWMSRNTSIQRVSIRDYSDLRMEVSILSYSTEAATST